MLTRSTEVVTLVYRELRPYRQWMLCAFTPAIDRGTANFEILERKLTAIHPSNTSQNDLYGSTFSRSTRVGSVTLWLMARASIASVLPAFGGSRCTT